MLLELIYLYLSLIVSLYLHELGHFGRRIHIAKWFPPMAASIDAKFRLGGLIVNGLIAGIIFYFKPEFIGLQIFGFVNWAYVILYLILGSFNKDEYRIPGFNGIISDDVPNNLRILWIPLGVGLLIFMWGYYIPIIVGLI